MNWGWSFHDTGLSPLQGVIEEVKAVRMHVDQLHGKITAFATGTQASEQALVKAINEQPDILYYSGHGEIIEGEELLVLNTDLSVKKPLSTTTFFGNQQLSLLASKKNKPLFNNSPLIILNCCNSGRTRNYGGAREDLVSTFLRHGAGTVIATALPINDTVGKEFADTLFSPTIANKLSIGDQVLETRRSLANGLCSDVKKPFWAAWGMIHIHGSADAAVPFQKQ